MASDLDAQIKSLEKKLNKIATVETQKAVSMALNVVAKRAKIRVARMVSEKTGIKVGKAKTRIFVRRANFKKGYADITMYSRSFSAIHGDFRKTALGYKVGKQGYKRAFFAKGLNNDRHHIYQRKEGKARLPIKMVRINIQQYIDQYGLKIIEGVRSKHFKKEFKRALNARLNGYVTTRR